MFRVVSPQRVDVAHPLRHDARFGSSRLSSSWLTATAPVFIAEGEEARYVGDMLAAVAAETHAATDGRLTIPGPASCVAVTGFQLMPSRIEPNAPIREIEVLGVPAP